MAEYIDKVAFNCAIREAVRRYPNSFYNGLEVARQIAHDFPAADVVPVRHGKWVSHDIGGRMSIDNDACSECGSVFYQIAETGCVWNFCPNCGADMREES